jgi:hypothetical protein
MGRFMPPTLAWFARAALRAVKIALLESFWHTLLPRQGSWQKMALRGLAYACTLLCRVNQNASGKGAVTF